MLFDIIIPVYNQPELTIACLKSIRQYSKDYRIILIDNGSNQEDMLEIADELVHHNHLLVTNKENLGFVKAMNQGIRRAVAPFIVFMNNDCEAMPDWLDKLKAGLNYNNSVGAVGPLTTTPNSWQGYFEPYADYQLLEGKSMIAFFCTMFKREVFQVVGLLDEDFGVGLGDDDNFCHRMVYHGYNICLCGCLRIPHHHRSTFKTLYTDEEIKQMQKEALKLVNQKQEELLNK